MYICVCICVITTCTQSTKLNIQVMILEQYKSYIGDVIEANGKNNRYE